MYRHLCTITSSSQSSTTTIIKRLHKQQHRCVTPFAKVCATLQCTWSSRRGISSCCCSSPLNSSTRSYHHRLAFPSDDINLTTLPCLPVMLDIDKTIVRSPVVHHSLRCFSTNASSHVDIQKTTKTQQRQRTIPNDGLQLGDFVRGGDIDAAASTTVAERRKKSDHDLLDTVKAGSEQQHQQIHNNMLSGMSFHIKTYGCQMNVNDTEIVRRILLDAGLKENLTDEISADIVLTNTCSIRDKAEVKVWNRLKELRSRNQHHHQQQKRRKSKQKKFKQIIGVLGCMAERLHEQIIQEQLAHVVVGPDAYRDLPNLISQQIQKQHNQSNPPKYGTVYDHTTKTTTAAAIDTQDDEDYHDPIRSSPVTAAAVNVQLSLDETYSDIVPARNTASSTSTNISAFVSIQRGCDNRCSFCVVPFTRGVERSRPMQTIVDEITRLYEEDGVKEVTLLGQNVNSYYDTSDTSIGFAATGISEDSKAMDGSEDNNMNPKTIDLSNEGFRRRQRRKNEGMVGAYTFADLLDHVSDISPELRVRFTSPHPKDYPPQLLQLMSEKPNICSQLHMPAQSGSSYILKRMKRGYTRDAYLRLIDDVQSTIPDVALSTDLIAGFCGEREEDHADTLSLLQQVQYDQAYLFAYSVREGTHAHRAYDDDVHHTTKQRRLRELIDTYQTLVHAKNTNHEVGRLRLVLVEGPAHKKKENISYWTGRTDQNKRILFTSHYIINDEFNEIDHLNHQPLTFTDECIQPLLHHILQQEHYQIMNDTNIMNLSTVDEHIKSIHASGVQVPLSVGDYAVVEVTQAKGHTLRGRVLFRTTLDQFAKSGLSGCDELSMARADLLRKCLSPPDDTLSSKAQQVKLTFSASRNETNSM